MKDKVYDGGFTLSAKKVAVGIDQSYSGFGITFMDIDTGKYKTTVFKAEYLHVERLDWIREKLLGMLHQLHHASQVVVAMEGYAFGSQMSHMLGELGAVVKLACYDGLSHEKHGRYPYIIPPTVLKKYVTGKGSGVQKNQILLQVYKKWGVEFNNDNAADSYALAHLAAGKCELAYEREIYHNIQDPKYREK